uniref:Uncharacterized protein n=1 Tax=Steinernema glaseri TaxID=37863 RepID=A0A1I7Y1W2_9BILA
MIRRISQINHEKETTYGRAEEEAVHGGSCFQQTDRPPKYKMSSNKSVYIHLMIRSSGRILLKGLLLAPCTCLLTVASLPGDLWTASPSDVIARDFRRFATNDQSRQLLCKAKDIVFVASPTNDVLTGTNIEEFEEIKAIKAESSSFRSSEQDSSLRRMFSYLGVPTERTKQRSLKVLNKAPILKPREPKPRVSKTDLLSSDLADQGTSRSSLARSLVFTVHRPRTFFTITSSFHKHRRVYSKDVVVVAFRATHMQKRSQVEPVRPTREALEIWIQCWNRRPNGDQVAKGNSSFVPLAMLTHGRKQLRGFGDEIGIVEKRRGKVEEG